MATLDALRQKQSKLMDQITGAKSDKIKRFYKRKLLLLNKEIGEVQAKGQIRQIWGQSAEEAKAKLKMAEKKRALEKSTKELKAAAKKAKESIPTTPSTSTKTVRTVVRGAKPGISGKVKAGIALGTIGVGALGLRGLRHKKKVRETFDQYRLKLKESIMENEDFLGNLYSDMRTSAKEWQGPNIPYGDDSNRPNLIRKCTMMESDQQKINCLRKLRDQAAMNPFYQYRIDRYIDEITDTYEPTEKPGTIPGNEFKESGVGEDTPTSASLNESVALGVLTTANIIMISALAYRDFFSKIARQCSSRVVELSYKKELCMTKARILALNHQIKQLKSDSKKCQRTKNPVACKAKINQQINKLKIKISKRKIYAKKIIPKVKK